MIIYKGSKEGKIWKEECLPNNNDPNKIVYSAVQKNGWMDEDLMKQWMKYLYCPIPHERCDNNT